LNQALNHVRFRAGKEGLLCHTVWDLLDGEAILMGTVEDGVGIPRGTEYPFLHGGLQRRRKRSGFLRRKRNFFEKGWARSRRD
jgi:hypothetical protein